MISKAFNKKYGVLKLMAVLISLVLLLSIMVMPVNAAVNGSLTFYHGIDQSLKSTYGTTISTAVENNMYFTCYLYFETGPYAGQLRTYYSPVAYNRSWYDFILLPGSVKGSSLFDYYVDSTLKHTSTDWWDFDFR